LTIKLLPVQNSPSLGKKGFTTCKVMKLVRKWYGIPYPSLYGRLFPSFGSSSSNEFRIPMMCVLNLEFQKVLMRVLTIH